MTNPLFDAHDELESAIDAARIKALENIKPALAEVFVKVPWLASIKFGKDNRYNDEDYYTPNLDEIGLSLFFEDDNRNMSIPFYAFYEDDEWYNDGDLTDDEKTEFIKTFKPIITDVTGDMLDLLFPEYGEWVIFSDGTIEPYDETESEDE